MVYSNLYYILLLCHESYKEYLLSFIIKTPTLLPAIVLPNCTPRMTSYQGGLLMNNVLCVVSVVDKLDCFEHQPAVN